jgi:hypothetical protein
MGLPSSRTTDQDDVLGRIHEVAAMQLAHAGFVDLAIGKVEAREVLVGREACSLHVISNRTDFPFRQFGLQEL